MFFFIASLPGLFASRIFSSEVVSSYECGFEPSGPSHVQFCLKFFLICLFFVLFDLEILYLFPSIIASRVLIPFVLVLLLGTVIEYAFGTLDWIS